MMHSKLGCTLRITASSNKVQNSNEPEKVKSFNKFLSKADIAAEEYEQRQQDLHVQGLEEKFKSKYQNLLLLLL